MKLIKMTTKQALNYVLKYDKEASFERIAKAIRVKTGSSIRDWTKKDIGMPVQAYKKWKNIYPGILITDIRDTGSKVIPKLNIPMEKEIFLSTREAMLYVMMKDEKLKNETTNTKISILSGNLGKKLTGIVKTWISGKGKMSQKKYLLWKNIYPKIIITDVGQFVNKRKPIDVEYKLGNIDIKPNVSMPTIDIGQL